MRTYTDNQLLDPCTPDPRMTRETRWNWHRQQAAEEKRSKAVVLRGEYWKFLYSLFVPKIEKG
jgi:hypothetical protein